MDNVTNIFGGKKKEDIKEKDVKTSDDQAQANLKQAQDQNMQMNPEQIKNVPKLISAEQLITRLKILNLDKDTEYTIMYLLNAFNQHIQLVPALGLCNAYLLERVNNLDTSQVLTEIKIDKDKIKELETQQFAVGYDDDGNLIGQLSKKS